MTLSDPAKRRFTAVVLFAAALTLATPLRADDSHELPSDEAPVSLLAPTEITADSMDFDVENQTAVFVGNVVVHDGDVELNADKMTIEFDETDQLKRVDAEGNVRIVSGGNEATAGKGLYDVKDGSIILTEEPILKQGLHQVVGAKKVVYYKAEGRFKTVEGRPTIKYFPQSGVPKNKDIESTADDGTE